MSSRSSTSSSRPSRPRSGPTSPTATASTYGTLGGELHADAALGERVVAALREQGLAPTWSGDPFDTIELRGFVWQRRDWPEEEDDAPWTAEDALAAWLEHMRATSRSAMAASLGPLHMHGLVDLGHVDIALACARAHSTAAVSPWQRCVALAELAVRLESAELALEALACVPFGGPGLLLDVLLILDLRDPAVRRAARTRALEARPDRLGVASVAWYLARSEEDDEGLLARVRQRMDRPDEREHYGDESGQAATAAALWMVHTRRGEHEPAAEMRARVVAALADEGRASLGFASRGIQIAARACGDVALAESFPARPRPASIAEAEANIARIREGYEEGLYLMSELDAAEYDLLLLKLAEGNREANVREYAALARSSRDAVVGTGAELRAGVEQVRGGGSPIAFTADESLLEPEAVRRLQRQVEMWTAAPDREGRRRLASRGRRILATATAMAGRGDLARASELAALVLDADERPVVDAREAIVALLAIGELDRAVAHADAVFPGCEAIAPLVVHLAAANRVDEALAWLRRAFSYAWNRGRVVALAPAVLAVAEDPQAAAEEMLACWDEANASLADLVPAGWLAGRT